MSYLVSFSAFPYRAGQQNLGNLVTGQTVTFSNPMPTTGYAVSFAPISVMGTAITISAVNKTLTGFTVGLSAGVVGGVTVDYAAWINN